MAKARAGHEIGSRLRPISPTPRAVTIAAVTGPKTIASPTIEASRKPCIFCLNGRR